MTYISQQEMAAKVTWEVISGTDLNVNLESTVAKKRGKYTSRQGGHCCQGLQGKDCFGEGYEPMKK